ncbi:glucokinase [Kaarinaea lacus]
MSKTILAGDIGGTKTLLTVAKVSGSIDNAVIDILAEHRFDSQAYATFDELLAEFCAQPWRQTTDAVQNACIGVAGPVKGHLANVTNLPWELNGDALADQFGMGQIRLINDFQAVGYGIELLKDEDFCQLQTGEPQHHGVRAVIGAGTGLGHGILIWQQDRYEVFSSEGGHVSFAPTDALQIELLKYLQRKFTNVSFEMVCSGPGLENIYSFLADRNGRHATYSLSAAEITQLAFDQKDPVAQLAMQMFIKIYGAQSGNLALTCLASGGLYVAGGIAPKILPALQQGEFIEAFNEKSKMHNLLKAIPVSVVTNPKVGLLGTIAVAAFHMQEGKR